MSRKTNKDNAKGISAFQMHRKIMVGRIHNAILSAISVRMRQHLGKYAIIPYDQIANAARMDVLRIVNIINAPTSDITLDEISDIMLALGMELSFSILPLPEFEAKHTDEE